MLEQIQLCFAQKELKRSLPRLPAALTAAQCRRDIPFSDMEAPFVLSGQRKPPHNTFHPALVHNHL
ncbi:hypothetical protein PTR77_05805 [Serratia bockelmannii]|uniref:hypothetical protein n=1 Tax=Serratia bockelmannii TaxID=2703793 RepID=UPI00313CFCFA